ncbi:MAG: hypothetical protein J1E84_02785 [Muribaculaceae bacterium]|nr:hypothetical protein [Muribaculaceae bacterium]
MKNFITLLLALCLGSIFSWAGTIGVKNFTKGLEKTRKEVYTDENPLDGSTTTSGSWFNPTITENDVYATISNNGYERKTAYGTPTLPDDSKTDISQFGTFSLDLKTLKVKLKVSKKVKNVKIYYTADSDVDHIITLTDSNGRDVDVKYYGSRVKYNNSAEYLNLVTLDYLPIGNYTISSPNDFTGGFVGMTYESISDASSPRVTSLQTTTESTTWDFEDVSATSGTNYESNNSAYQTYAYFYSRNSYYNSTLKYNTEFEGDKIEFQGQYPIYNGSANRGTLHFKTDGPGAVRVTFSVPAYPTSESHRRYLAVNNERTDYWTSRATDEYDEQLNITSGYIPVPEGDVYISGMKQMGEDDDISISKVEYVKFKESGSNNEKKAGFIVGVTLDTFTERVIEYKDSKSVSTWTYGGYKHSTHGLVGGVEDNGIYYYSSTWYDTDEKYNRGDTNTNGNITFNGADGKQGEYFLSCQYGSTIYVPVPKKDVTGTITLKCTQDDYKNSGTGTDRYFELHTDTDGNFNGTKETGTDKTIEEKYLPLKKTSTADITSSCVTEINGKYYLKLVSNFKEAEYIKNRDNTYPDYPYRGEMKVYSISVAINNTNYNVEEVEDDYDHEIGDDHAHALFNWTEADIETSKDDRYGTVTLKRGSQLIGNARDYDETPDQNTSSGLTNPISSYRNGDMVKYKTNYYGSIQMIKNATYTIKAPTGYHITTSVRIHGYNNRNTNDYENDTYMEESYIGMFNGGVFEGTTDNTYMKFFRDDKNARTTTLDFIVPATKELNFKVDGYQLLGIVDAVMVPDGKIPTITSKVYYVAPGKTKQDAVALTENQTLASGGKIYYDNSNSNEELWWYFHPLNGAPNPRGCLRIDNSDSDYSIEGEGVKDQNFTKTFSVRNYKFVRAKGKFTTDSEALAEVYNDKNNYEFSLSEKIGTQNYVMPLAVDDSEYAQYPMTLDIEEDGTFYFYIRDTSLNYNSILSVSAFDSTVGVESVEVDNLLQAAGRDGFIYNIYGQRVDENYRGVVIKNGCKYVQK